ncbi:TPA: phage tail protein [Kluyvera ascorbata]|nr:phage tail protein [Kluyvera ascorbata]
MSAKFYTLMTDIGAAKLASAAALGIPLKITQMAVGDGGGALPTPDAKQTALVAEKRRAAMNMLYIDPQNSSQIIAEQVIPETEGGWWIREVGLFDETGALIAVGNCPESYKPQLVEGSGRTQTVRMVLITSSTDNITLKIDPSVVLATRSYVDNLIETRQQKSDTLTALAELKPAKGKFPYFTAEKAAALADLSDYIRLMLGKADAAGVLEYLGLQDSFSGRVLRVKKITTSQLYEWSDGVAEIDVIICGGGGGGGAGVSVPAGYCSAGSGGGAGGHARSRYKRDDVPSEIPIEIGAGGKGGIANGSQPTNGGISKFGTLMTAYGGGRAANGIAFQQTGASMLVGNGGGAEAEGGNLFSSRGGSGTPAIFLSNGYESGAGGDSVFSFGPPPLTTNVSLAGIKGLDGAGGGGAVIIENTAGQNGGDGGNGACLIVEYSE